MNTTDELMLPITPYNGTGGWSGSETSRQRAEHEVQNGTLSERQNVTFRFISVMGAHGATWKELATAYNWHHGQASGVLSNLHKDGFIVRLTETRSRCAVYVIPEFANNRDVSEFGRTKKDESFYRSAIAEQIKDYCVVQHGDNDFIPCECLMIIKLVLND